jgi:hypothetical protein
MRVSPCQALACTQGPQGGNEKALGIVANLVHNAVVLSESEVKLIVVHLELVLLE